MVRARLKRRRSSTGTAGRGGQAQHVAVAGRIRSSARFGGARLYRYRRSSHFVLAGGGERPGCRRRSRAMAPSAQLRRSAMLQDGLRAA